MVVGTCGFGSTGSSVISDYLSEYGNISVVDGVEFTIASCTDGIYDLREHVMNPHNRTSDSIEAINRFRKLINSRLNYYEKATGIRKDVFEKLTEEFIDSIVTVSWMGYTNDDKGFISSIIKDKLLMLRIIPKLERRLGRQINCYPMKKVDLSVRPSDFDIKAKKYVKNLLIEMGADFNKMVVLDQPFSGNNPQACFDFFDDPYAIVVDRDPRDNYVFGMTRLIGQNHFMALNGVQNFVKYYRVIRDNQPYRNENNRVLSVQFEELVYDYDIATKKIKKFLNLPENPNPKSVFDPDLSINNTQVWKRFPRFKKDIEYIEYELSDYLFDFDKYGDITPTGEMFHGKSPLHK